MPNFSGNPLIRPLLTEEEFGREVVGRARQERPEIRLQQLDRLYLLVEPVPGQQRVVSLSNVYQNYVDAPEDKDDMINSFLANQVYEAPMGITGDFATNRDRILPQVVPPSLLEFCEREGRDLAALAYAADLHIAFVVDEEERYCYLDRSVAERWGVSPLQLMTTALGNLERISAGVRWQQFGKGTQAMFAVESFDGYDASRILMSKDMIRIAGKVAGQVVIAIPHRDYLMAFGDADPEFVAQLTEHVRQDFEQHSYPITSQLFTLDTAGRVVPYTGPTPGDCLVN